MKWPPVSSKDNNGIGACFPQGRCRLVGLLWASENPNWDGGFGYIREEYKARLESGADNVLKYESANWLDLSERYSRVELYMATV